MTSVELCLKMLHYSVFAKHTEDRRASEVKEALKFFFTQDEIDQAIAIITGRASPDSAQQQSEKP